MSDIADIIADLVRAGVDPALIGRVAGAFATREAVIVKDVNAEKRRERDRERKRLRNSAEVSGNVLSPDKEVPPAPLQEINPLTPTPLRGTSPRFADPAIVLQSETDPMTARAFVDHLAQKRKPLSAQSAEALVTTLREIRTLGGNPTEALKLTIKKNWASLEIEYLRNAGMKMALPASTVDWAGRMAVFGQDQTWVHAWGPKPGEAGCKVPPAFIQDRSDDQIRRELKL